MPINPTPTIPILTTSVFPLLFGVYGFAPFSRLACFAPFFRIPGAFPGAFAIILSRAKPTGHFGERSCPSGLTGSATSAPSLARPRGRSLPQLPGLIRLPDPPPTFGLQGGQGRVGAGPAHQALAGRPAEGGLRSPNPPPHATPARSARRRPCDRCTRASIACHRRSHMVCKQRRGPIGPCQAE